MAQISDKFIAKIKWGKTCGVGLKYIRVNKRLTQEQLAEKVGVSRQTISEWESGTKYQEFPYDRVCSVCDALGISVKEFLTTCLKETK